MKTKELIRQLQEADPEGDLEVSVGNVDIYFVEKLPTYYDGRQQVLIRDETKTGYNIVGAKVRSSGSKVKIHCVSISDAIWDNPEIPIDYSDLTPERADEYKASHEKIRASVRECESDIELGYFTEHIVKRVRKLTEDEECVLDLCRDFFVKNLSPNDAFPANLPIIGESYYSRRNKQWQEQIDVSYDADGVKIKLR